MKTWDTWRGGGWAGPSNRGKLKFCEETWEVKLRGCYGLGEASGKCLGLEEIRSWGNGCKERIRGYLRSGQETWASTEFSPGGVICDPRQPFAHVNSHLQKSQLKTLTWSRRSSVWTISSVRFSVTSVENRQTMPLIPRDLHRWWKDTEKCTGAWLGHGQARIILRTLPLQMSLFSGSDHMRD